MGVAKNTDAGERVLYTVAGLADLVATRLNAQARILRGLLGRADLKELILQAQNDLMARGDLVMKRRTDGSVPHLELLAQRAISRQKRANA
ncbi:hypothetical protein ACOZ38_17800 [Sphaerisporangium viridialbum]|uniref:hypothetical protein n=1 Tax=Sphaerisporangium viridialbum TaxID=46189 RepID=UPI003C738717